MIKKFVALMLAVAFLAIVGVPTMATAGDWWEDHQSPTWNWNRGNRGWRHGWQRGERFPDADDWLANGSPNPSGDYWTTHPRHYRRYQRQHGRYGNYSYYGNVNPYRYRYYNPYTRPYSYQYENRYRWSY